MGEEPKVSADGGVGFVDLFNLLRTDISTFRSENNQRLDKLVSTDLFTAEQRRVDGRFKDMADDMQAQAIALAKETEARHTAENKQRELEREREAEKVALQSRNRWTIVGFIASPLIGTMIAFLLAGGLKTP